jgi:hypothetical protein
MYNILIFDLDQIFLFILLSFIYTVTNSTPLDPTSNRLISTVRKEPLDISSDRRKLESALSMIDSPSKDDSSTTGSRLLLSKSKSGI